LSRAERINQQLADRREAFAGSGSKVPLQLINLLGSNPFLTPRETERRLGVAYTGMRASAALEEGASWPRSGKASATASSVPAPFWTSSKSPRVSCRKHPPRSAGPHGTGELRATGTTAALGGSCSESSPYSRPRRPRQRTKSPLWNRMRALSSKRQAGRRQLHARPQRKSRYFPTYSGPAGPCIRNAGRTRRPAAMDTRPGGALHGRLPCFPNKPRPGSVLPAPSRSW